MMKALHAKACGAFSLRPRLIVSAASTLTWTRRIYGCRVRRGISIIVPERIGAALFTAVADGFLALAVSRTKEVPKDQSKDWQESHRQYPNQLLLVGNGALEDIDNCPHITSKYQHAKKAVVSEVHRS